MFGRLGLESIDELPSETLGAGGKELKLAHQRMEMTWNECTRSKDGKPESAGASMAMAATRKEE